MHNYTMSIKKANILCIKQNFIVLILLLTFWSSQITQIYIWSADCFSRFHAFVLEEQVITHC